MSDPHGIKIEVADSLAAYRDSAATAALPPLRIAHLSDLHFVTHAALRRLQRFYKGVRGHDADTQQALENVIQELRPDLLFATGDHTTWGDKKSLIAAHDFLISLGRKINLTEERIFWTPGNHDILLHYYFRVPGVQRNYNGVFGPLQPVRLLDIAGYKIAVFSFDSTLDRKGQWSPLWPLVASRGRISRRSFNEFNQALRDTPGLDKCLKIAQVHHRPLPIPYKGGESADIDLTTMTNGGTFIAYMQESGVNLILHGHEHFPYSCRYCYDPNGEDIILVAAGTSCQSKTQQNSFNYLEVVPGVHIVVRQYKCTEVGFRIDRGATQIFAFDKS